MVSIEVRNASRRLVRPYFSKLGWLAKVIWRIAISIPLPFYEREARWCDLFRGSLTLEDRIGSHKHPGWRVPNGHFEICVATRTDTE
jgi:hypothetical protein